jgi:hypothetical protein
MDDACDGSGQMPNLSATPGESTMSTRPADVAASPSSPYVLPGRKRAAGDVIVVPPIGGEGFARGGRVAHSLGDRFLSLAECQQRFLTELRQRLELLDGAIAEDSRAQLKGALRGALDVLEWCDAVQADLTTESNLAAGGLEPIDLAEICRLIAAEPGSHVGDVRVTGRPASHWWGDAGLLATAVRQGLHLVSERIGGSGFRQIEVGSAASGHWIRIAGFGEPTEVEPASAVAFRQSAERLQARVTPDALGPGAAGLVLQLPVRDA